MPIPSRDREGAVVRSRLGRPALGQAVASTKRAVQILLVTRGREHVLLHKRDALSTPWANLWAFPYLERRAGEAPTRQVQRWAKESLGGVPDSISVVAKGKYSVTRYRFEFEAFAFSVKSRQKQKLPPGCAWVKWSQLGEYAMPAPHRKVALSWEGP